MEKETLMWGCNTKQTNICVKICPILSDDDKVIREEGTSDDLIICDRDERVYF